MSYLVESLVESIKRRSLAPISQSTYDDTDLIDMASEELQLSLVSALIKPREDFFLTTESADITENIDHYRIPSRAIGNSIKDLFYVDTAGNKRALNRVESKRREDYSSQASEPLFYFIEGDEVVLLPKPSLTLGSIEFLFPANPGILIATSSCAKISSISSNASTITMNVNTDLSGSLSVGSKIDIVSAESPFKLWVYRSAITQITSGLIEIALADGVDSNDVVLPQVNDYICPTGFSNIPQIPIAFHPILAQKTAASILHGLGDLNKMSAANAIYEKMMSEAGILVKNRVEASPQKASGKQNIARYIR